MNGFGKLAFVENEAVPARAGRGARRCSAFPVALVVGFGMIPGFGKPDKSLSGQIGTEYIASLGVAIVIVMLGLNGIPAVMGLYREKGILRRLSATPVRPAAVLLAKMLVWLATVLVSVTLVITVSRLAFHVPTAGAARLVRAVRRARRGGAVRPGHVRRRGRADEPGRDRASAGCCSSPTCSWPGVYFPTEQMSHTLQVIGDYAPLGAALHAVRQSWMGQDPRPLYLGIMAAWAVVAGPGGGPVLPLGVRQGRS